MQDSAVTAAKIGTLPAARAEKDLIGTGSSVGAFAVAPVTFPTEGFDTQNLHSTVSNTDRMTAPVAGIYEVSVIVEYDGRGAALFLGVSSVTAQSGLQNFVNPAAATVTCLRQLQVTGMFTLQAGDYISVSFYNDYGQPVNVRTGDFFMHFVSSP